MQLLGLSSSHAACVFVVPQLGEYRIIARPLSLQQPVFSSARPSLFASVPVYRRLHGFQNSTGTYVRSTYYSDARCQIRVSSYDTALGAHCFETLEEDRGVRRPMSFSLSWDTSASLVTQAVFRGTGCAHPHTFPVDWALGDLNTNRSSYRAADGECFRHLCGMSHLSQDAPSYSTLKGFNNRSGVFITRSHFADSVCAVPVYSDVVSARTCINDGLVAQSHKPTVERKQSWFAVWDAERRATSATVFVGDGCVVPASYAVYRSTGGDNRTARRRLQDNEADGELWTIVLPWLVIGGMLCSCVGCYYCLFVLMAREIDSSAEDAVQP